MSQNEVNFLVLSDDDDDDDGQVFDNTLDVTGVAAPSDSKPAKDDFEGSSDDDDANTKKAPNAADDDNDDDDDDDAPLLPPPKKSKSQQQQQQQVVQKKARETISVDTESDTSKGVVAPIVPVLVPSAAARAAGSDKLDFNADGDETDEASVGWLRKSGASSTASKTPRSTSAVGNRTSNQASEPVVAAPPPSPPLKKRGRPPKKRDVDGLKSELVSEASKTEPTFSETGRPSRCVSAKVAPKSHHALRVVVVVVVAHCRSLAPTFAAQIGGRRWRHETCAHRRQRRHRAERRFSAQEGGGRSRRRDQRFAASQQQPKRQQEQQQEYRRQ